MVLSLRWLCMPTVFHKMVSLKKRMLEDLAEAVDTVELRRALTGIHIRLTKDVQRLTVSHTKDPRTMESRCLSLTKSLMSNRCTRCTLPLETRELAQLMDPGRLPDVIQLGEPVASNVRGEDVTLSSTQMVKMTRTPLPREILLALKSHAALMTMSQTTVTRFRGREKEKSWCVNTLSPLYTIPRLPCLLTIQSLCIMRLSSLFCTLHPCIQEDRGSTGEMH